MIGMDAQFVSIDDLARAPSVAIVVDVMRAFTAAASEFARGADKIVLAATLDEALALKSRHPDWVTLKDGHERSSRIASPHRLAPAHRGVFVRKD